MNWDVDSSEKFILRETERDRDRERVRERDRERETNASKDSAIEKRKKR